MSKVRFDLKRIAVSRSVRLAGKVLQSIDTEIHQTLANAITIDLFSRGGEQGFSLLRHDTELPLRVAFVEEYKQNRIIVYYAPFAKMGDFMRELTELANNRASRIKTARFPAEHFIEAAKFVCRILEFDD